MADYSPNNNRDCGEKQEKSANWKSVGRLSDDLIELYMSSWCEFSVSVNDDAHARYTMQEALDRVRPSLIFALMKVSRDLQHFTHLLSQAACAAAMPEHAEEIGGHVCDQFGHDEAHKADVAWQVMLITAAQAADPDPEWQQVAAISDRVRGAFGGRKKSLLEQMLSAGEAQVVTFNPLDGIGGGQ